MKILKIRTNFEYPPIPLRDYDWSAVDDDTYEPDSNRPVGWGRTEAQAIEDLLERLEYDGPYEVIR